MTISTIFIYFFKLAFSLNIIVLIASDRNEFNFDIKMPGITPKKNDQYFCTAKAVNVNEAFIVGFEAHASVSRAHHMILFGSTEDFRQPSSFENFWDCGHGGLPSGIKIMFAWAKNAPPVILPKDVGFRIGQDTITKYLILQVHYANPLPAYETDASGLTLKMTYQKQKYLAGIYLLADSHSVLPPYKPKTHVDINCRFQGADALHVFAYRVHAHQLGLVISGYSYNTRNESWTLLAKGNPQWPQAFYPMDFIHTITADDILSARCTYNTSSRTKPVEMGFSSNDEMCNLYLMYYVEAAKIGSLKDTSCGLISFPHLVGILPEGSDVSLPKNSSLEEMAIDLGPPTDAEDLSNSQFLNQQITLAKKGNGHSGIADQVFDTPEESEPSALPKAGPQFDDSFSYKEISTWPKADVIFGQISAVTFDSFGNVVIFHRGSHVWNGETFDLYNVYKKVDEGPIADYTVLTLDSENGNIIHRWGSNLFYMPHGLTIDSKGNAWVTDVAMHQVFLFNEKGDTKALLTLGERFVPGNDEYHFCKPASVAPGSDGDIYVADGYCNTRIVRFSSSGKYKSQFGERNDKALNPPPINTFEIPHKVILVENETLICVADRENGRIQCFQRDNGKFSFQILREEFNGRLFSISATKGKGGLLYAVCGPSLGSPQDHLVQAFVFNLTTRSLLNIVTPKQGTFSQPHDIAISADAQDLYVVEIGPDKIWKFQRAGAHKSPLLLPEATDSKPSIKPVIKTSASAVVEAGNFATSMVIMALLGIPILLLILITVIVRLKKRGKFQHCSLPHVKGWLGGYRTPRSANEKFNIGSLLNPHKGFDRVALDESDLEADDKSDSDVEEFNAVTRKA